METTIEDLPEDILRRFATQYLTFIETHNLALTSRRLWQVLADEQQLWRPRCMQEFGAKTEVDKWVVAHATPMTPSRTGLPPRPTTTNNNTPTTPIRTTTVASISIQASPTSNESAPLPRPPHTPSSPAPGGLHAALHSSPNARGTSPAPLPRPPPATTASRRAPHSYRKLYKLLSEYASLEGLWIGINLGDSADPRGTLLVLRLEASSLRGYRLLGHHRPSWRLDSHPVLSISPDCATHEVSLLSNPNLLTLRPLDTPLSASLPRAAELAATSVATGSPADVLGSSPVGSFEYELLRFQQANLQRRRNQRAPSPALASGASTPPSSHSPMPLARRRPRRASYGSSSSQALTFRRVEAAGLEALLGLNHFPCPIRAPMHTLEGLWKGHYGSHGLEVVLITYEPMESPSQGVPSDSSDSDSSMRLDDSEDEDRATAALLAFRAGQGRILGSATRGHERSASASSPRSTPYHLVCTKLIGDVNVPSQERTWTANVAQGDVTDQDILSRLADLRFHPMAMRLDASSPTTVSSSSSSSSSSPSSSSSSSGSESEDESAGLSLQELSLQSSRNGPDASSHPLSRSVRAIYKGKGRVARTGFVHPRYVEGCLLEFEENHDVMAFGFLSEYDFLVMFRRLEMADFVQQSEERGGDAGT